MSRVRNRRPGAWVELPEDDGLVATPYQKRGEPLRIVLMPAEVLHLVHARNMKEIDRLPAFERYIANYCGKVAARKKELQVRKLDKTTPSLSAFATTTVSSLEELGL